MKTNKDTFLALLMVVLTAPSIFVQDGKKTNKQKEETIMENHALPMKEFNLLVYAPLTYGGEQAKEVREQWNQLLEKWKSNGTFVTSFVYPGIGKVVTGSEMTIQEYGITCGRIRLISNLIVKAPHFDAALELAKQCPVLKQGASIEVREIPPRVSTPEPKKN